MHYKTLPIIIKFLDLYEEELDEIISINLDRIKY